MKNKTKKKENKKKTIKKKHLKICQKDKKYCVFILEEFLSPKTFRRQTQSSKK